MSGLLDGEAAPAELRVNRGRPRSETVEKAILDATMALIAGGESLANLSIEAVAAKAGVGKATIYRRWPGRDELLLDALGAIRVPMPSLPGRSVRDDIRLILAAIADQDKCDMPTIFNARAYGAVLVEGSRNPEFVRRYRAEVVEPRRDILRAVLERGVQGGELRADTDIDLMMDLLTAPLIQRLIQMQPGGKLPAAYTDRLAEGVFSGFAAR